MLAHTKVKQIERLLAEGGRSLRKIAKLVGVSRAVVCQIANGTRPDYETLRQDCDEEFAPLGPVERCRGCGGLVHMPCRLCEVRGRLLLGRQKTHQLETLRRQARIQNHQRVIAAVKQANTSGQALEPTARGPRDSGPAQTAPALYDHQPARPNA